MEDLLDAELELCDSDKARVTVLEQAVKLAKEHEAVAETLYRTGKASQSDILMAKVSRLGTEIALERVMAKGER